jgi:formate dehydrogenase gamma subunit
VRNFYYLVIPVTVGFMLLHNLGDWIRKVARSWRGAASPRIVENGALRMYPFERFAHLLLATSFIVLAWTGFALQYPNQWWAQPLLGEARRNVHRFAAVVFTLVGMLHLISLIVSPKLRTHWKVFIPRVSDIREGIAMFAYNLGLRKTRPHLSTHSYIEKVEYWAVIWGSGLMLATGVVLWANNIALRWLPKSWLDVATAIHWYEAILAVLSILIWHFYSVIFDPDVYPLDTAWLNGRTIRKHDDPLSSKESESPE